MTCPADTSCCYLFSIAWKKLDSRFAGRMLRPRRLLIPWLTLAARPMSLFKLRPTFCLSLRESRAVAIERLRAAYEQTNAPESFKMFGEYGELHLPVSEHRLWSPHLSFYVAERPADDAQRSALIHGRFAPRLEVWTLVWIVYLFMSFSTFFGLTLAYSQWMLNENPAWGIGIAVVGVVAINSLTAVAAIGQQWSADQMLELRERLESLLGAAELNIENPNPAETV